jgi:hypothetical protein
LGISYIAQSFTARYFRHSHARPWIYKNSIIIATRN